MNQENLLKQNKNVLPNLIDNLISLVGFDFCKYLRIQFNQLPKRIFATMKRNEILTINILHNNDFQSLLIIIVHELVHCFMFWFNDLFCNSHGYFFVHIEKLFFDSLLQDKNINQYLNENICQKELDSSKDQFLIETYLDKRNVSIVRTYFNLELNNFFIEQVLFDKEIEYFKNKLTCNVFYLKLEYTDILEDEKFHSLINLKKYLPETKDKYIERIKNTQKILETEKMIEKYYGNFFIEKVGNTLK